MSDISEEKFNDMVASLNKISGSLGKIVDKMGSSSSGKSTSRSGAKKTLEDELNNRKKDSDSLKDHYERVKDSAGTFKALKSTMVKFGEGFVGVEIIKKAVELGAQNVKVYQDLSNYGQSFGGSMVNMAQQAGAAGIGLSTFAEIIKKNSVVVGQMGSQAFFSLNKQIRTLTESQGLYGYTVQQLADFSGTYLDQQRLAGKNLKDLANPTTARAIADFALNVTSISDVLGTERAQTMKNAMDAMNDATFLAQERINTAQGMEGANKALQGAITDLSAQAGEGGVELSKALAGAAGPLGANFTNLGKELNSLGQGQLTSVLDQANARLKAGADSSEVARDVVQQFHDKLMNPATLQYLTVLAQSGNAAAANILKMGESLKTYTAADIAKAKQDRKRTDTLTAFFESFESILGNIKGAFIDGFLDPFTKAFGSLDSDAAKNFWNSIQNELVPAAKELGGAFGNFLKEFLTKKNIDGMLNSINMIIQFGANAAKVGAAFVNGFMPVVKFVIGAFELLHKNLSIFGKNFADFGTTIAGLVAFLAGPILLKMFAGALMRAAFQSGAPVFVSGKIVTVTGGGAGGAAAAEAEAVAGAEGAALKAGEKAAAAGASKAAGKGILGKTIGGVGKAASKLAPKGLLSTLAKAGPKAIPIIGALAAAGISGFSEFNDSHNLAKSLFVAAGSGAGTLGGQAVGALAGGVGEIPGAIVGGMAGEAGAGMLYDKLFKGKGKDAAKSATGTPAAAGKDTATLLPTTPDAASPSNSSTTAQPVTLDDDAVMKLKTDAALGDKDAVETLKKIQTSIDRQTAMTVKLQKDQLKASQGVAGAISDSMAYGS